MEGCIHNTVSDMPDYSNILSWRNIPPRYLTEKEIDMMFGYNRAIPTELYHHLREDIDATTIEHWLNRKSDASKRPEKGWISMLKSDILWEKLFRKDYGYVMDPLEEDIIVNVRNNTCDNEDDNTRSSTNVPHYCHANGHFLTHRVYNDKGSRKYDRKKIRFGKDVESRLCKRSNTGSHRHSDTSRHKTRRYNLPKNNGGNDRAANAWYVLYKMRREYERRILERPVLKGELTVSNSKVKVYLSPTSFTIWRRETRTNVVDATRSNLQRWLVLR